MKTKKRYFFSIILGIGGLMFLGYGLISLNSQKQDKEDILFEAASDTSPFVKNSQPPVKIKEIVVDVQGAVMQPGVYLLQQDSRLHDALIAAGGLSESADRERVAKTINLAVKLTDGSKIYIPFEGEQNIVLAEQTVLGSENALININSASESQLDTLPGIGAVTAQKIISNRPYAAIEELVEKKAVGKSVFEKIKDKISVY